MEDIEILRDRLNKYVSDENISLSGKEALDLSHLLDKMMLNMYTAFGEPINMRAIAE